MEIIVHRVNNSSKLVRIPKNYGIEVDVRDYKKKLILNHDPFKNGENLEVFLKKYKQASKMADYQGLDRHDDNKWEERAERWAHKEWKRYWKKKLEKNN